MNGSYGFSTDLRLFTVTDAIHGIHELVIAPASAEGVDVGLLAEEFHNMIEDKSEILTVGIGNSKQNHKEDRFGSPDTFITVGYGGDKTLFDTVADRMRDRHFFDKAC